MAYCRWSTNDYQCDLYVYSSGDDQVTIHVAGNRVIWAEPLPEPVPYSDETFSAWFARREEVSRILRASTREPLGLPCDGESYDLSLRDGATKIRELIAMGYQCDPGVADRLDKEADELEHLLGDTT